jgi:galactokinase
LYAGEHIDYTLFGCFPAAIERDILIACAPRSGPTPLPPSAINYSEAKPKAEPHHDSGVVVAENLHSKYTRQVFIPAKKLGVADTSGGKDVLEDAVHVEQWHLDIDTNQLRWESYVKAGYYVGTSLFPLIKFTYHCCSHNVICIHREC